MMKFKIGDLLILLSVLLAAFILFPRANKADFALLQIDGVTVKEFDLSVDDEYIYHGEYDATVCISNGTAYIKSASCPDQTCVKCGPLNENNTVICCLPNKLILTYKTAQAETDVISG